MMYQIPLQSIPNQSLSVSIDDINWFITLSTRKDNLYISLQRNSVDVLLNRICRDSTPVGYGFVFVDQQGASDPTYDGLNERYALIYSGDE